MDLVNPYVPIQTCKICIWIIAVDLWGVSERKQRMGPRFIVPFKYCPILIRACSCHRVGVSGALLVDCKGYVGTRVACQIQKHIHYGCVVEGSSCHFTLYLYIFWKGCCLSMCSNCCWGRAAESETSLDDAISEPCLCAKLQIPDFDSGLKNQDPR